MTNGERSPKPPVNPLLLARARQMRHESAPAEEKLDSELVYVSATFARKPDEVDPIAIVVGATVANPRGGVALAVDGDRWMTTLLSTGVAEPPTDPESYVEWTAQAPNPGLYQLLAGLPIVERPHRMRVPPSVWRRFDPGVR